MPRAKTYHHFCPVARTLEVIGDKWSLLVVRDLLRGPLRFTDLQRYLGGITPKWLTRTLREMEQAGIVERESEPGRREVWYRLTPKGESLAPVVESLVVWGLEHAMRPPREDEPVYPEQSLMAVMTMLNHRGIRLRKPGAWRFRVGSDVRSLRFDGERWSQAAGDAEAGLLVETTPREWLAFLMAPDRDRRRPPQALRLEGSDANIAEFLSIFGYAARAATSPR
jgi:DNA-binding HxlR family transcriptional regulator